MPGLPRSAQLVSDTTFDGVVALAKSQIEKLASGLPHR
jgi:hypothetical protein